MHRIALALVPVLLVAAGCDSGSTLPPETDPAKGREVLKTALDAWARGGTPADLKPVVVGDPDWEGGHKLTAYAVDPADARAGVDLLLKVKLTLQRKDGATEDKSVNYVVAIGPQTVVLRYQ